MAHHGGRPVPRAHRPRAPTMSVHSTPPPTPHPTPHSTSSSQFLHPLTAPLAPLRPPPLTALGGPLGASDLGTSPRSPGPPPHSPVTLQAPRPDADRSTNEYVETPFRPPQQIVEKIVRPSRLPLPLSSSTTHHLHQLPVTTTHTVTKQPKAFTKEQPQASISNPDCATGNIICSDCGRCRCESCRAPRPLPSRWVCDNSCLCSADAIIDYASCLCCVKGLYYHCSDTDAGATCADDPCSCGPHRKLARWACLGALALVLPCLLCYWPLRGCQRGVEAAYARHTRAGCRCRPHQTTPEKRLLDSSPEY